MNRPDETPPLDRARPSILVVDDEAPQMRALADVLTRDGYRVLACAAGEEASRMPFGW